MSGVHVTSEIGELEAVLVHTPGRELFAVTPGTREHYLYDDIIDLEIAHREHRLMVSILDRFADVYEITDLLAKVLESTEVRESLVARTMDVVPSDALARQLMDLPTTELVTLLVEGERATPGPIASTLNEVGYTLPPVPNLFFTRDIGMVLGESVVIGSMRHTVRWTEEMLIRSIFEFHPELTNAGILYDGSEERRLDYSLEGGDVHPLREDLLVIGFSARSSPQAIDLMVDIVFEKTPVRDVLVVVMPNRMEAIHLDMIFTQVDREQCVCFPPLFMGPERVSVLHRTRGKDTVKEVDSLFSALKTVDMPLSPILCGGSLRPSQEREQWASGCNMVCLRPGLALAYARNDETLAEFEAAGFRIVNGGNLLTGEEDIRGNERAIITFVGSELVRGGGGPRCMTLPVRRKDP